MRAGGTVPVNMVVAGDEPRAVGLWIVAAPDGSGELILGAAPDTPAAQWLQRVGAAAVAEHMGLPVATREQYERFMAENEQYRVVCEPSEPMSVLDARHMRQARRAL